MLGNYGIMLIIDLTSQQVTEKKIEEKVYKEYLGGKGLGTYLLLNMLPPDTDPLSPENLLIFTTGPAVDTVLAPASRYGVFSKSPQTGFYSESYSGGHLPPVMKRTGYDALVIKGAASKPCYIHVSDQGVTFHDAALIWGEESYAAEEAILAALGVKGAQALVIGPAGERMIRFACIKNNRWRSAGRTGLGAVMGSKKLKGIAFSGSSKVSIADEEGLKKWNRDFISRTKDSPEAQLYRHKGTPAMVAISNKLGFFPTRYWSEGTLEGWENISADYMKEQMEVKSKGCYRCFFTCGKLTTALKGRHQGLQVEGPEFETIYSFGGLCCITEMEEILYLNDLCDRWGVDTMSAGNIAAFAIEAGMRGKLKTAPKYNDPDSVANFLQGVIEGKGEGALFSRGLKSAAKELGMDDFAIHVKGLEPAGYDPRVLKGMGLGYSTSSRGACHLRATFYKPEVAGIIDPAVVKDKARLFVEYEDKMNIYDCFIYCRFYRDLIHWEELIRNIHMLTGEFYSMAGLRFMAGRIQNMTRLFNIREGADYADDMLPKRFMQDPINEDRNLISEEDIKKMLSDYYLLRGWDDQGVPPDVGLYN